MAEKRCYTVKEVQEMLGISRAAVYDLLKHSDLHYVVVAGRYLVSKKSFDEWIDKTPPEPEHTKAKSL